LRCSGTGNTTSDYGGPTTVAGIRSCWPDSAGYRLLINVQGRKVTDDITPDRHRRARDPLRTCPLAHADALPLIVTNGWPGSLAEYLKVVGPLTDPTAYGGDPGDAFHLVLPTLPGYGFSDKPTGTAWGVERTADAWTRLMARLGYLRYGAHGTDWGDSVTTAIGQRDPGHVVGTVDVPTGCSVFPRTFLDRPADGPPSDTPTSDTGTNWTGAATSRPWSTPVFVDELRTFFRLVRP
jgi:pimeloyl-ACP methyl ester carboxylesterase